MNEATLLMIIAPIVLVFGGMQLLTLTCAPVAARITGVPALAWLGLLTVIGDVSVSAGG